MPCSYDPDVSDFMKDNLHIPSEMITKRKLDENKSLTELELEVNTHCNFDNSILIGRLRGKYNFHVAINNMIESYGNALNTKTDTKQFIDGLDKVYRFYWATCSQ
jgi:hypothetical protein